MYELASLRHAYMRFSKFPFMLRKMSHGMVPPTEGRDDNRVPKSFSYEGEGAQSARLSILQWNRATDSIHTPGCPKNVFFTLFIIL